MPGQGILAFVVLLGVLVTVHELGHFLAAKWAGVKVLKFSIGFGPPIVHFKSGETEYQIAWIPLGGYVKMAGELPGDDVDPDDARRSFLSAAWWKRAIIVSAGPVMNLIFPVLAFFFVFLGDHQGAAPRVGWLEPGYPAEQAGIRPGDVVTRVDGEPIFEYSEISRALRDAYDRDVKVDLSRDGKPLSFTLKPHKLAENEPGGKSHRGLLGISALARPAIIGVTDGSPAAAAGLKTFDRIVSVNGVPIKDELQLSTVVAPLEGPLTVVVVRSNLFHVGGAALVKPELATVTVEKQPGQGFEALGAESGDLYVWTVFPGSPADKAGLVRGDKLLTFDGKPIGSSFVLEEKLTNAGTDPFELAWRHDGETKSVKIAQAVEPYFDELNNPNERLELGLRARPAFQVASAMRELLAAGPEAEKMTIHMGPFDALKASARAVPDAISAVGTGIGRVFTGKVSFRQVGGPVTLFLAAQKSAEAGPVVFLTNMALISVNLGLVNLFPIPILDGFSLLAALWEGIRRRPIPMQFREYANVVGLVMLGALLVAILFANELPKLYRMIVG